MSTCLEVFHSYYTGKTQHRKLTWVHSLGTATVAARLKKKHDVIVNTLQGLILLLFADFSDPKPSHTVESLQRALGGKQKVDFLFIFK